MRRELPQGIRRLGILLRTRDPVIQARDGSRIELRVELMEPLRQIRDPGDESVHRRHDFGQHRAIRLREPTDDGQDRRTLICKATDPDAVGALEHGATRAS
jgi:hypothetical protein